MPIYEYKCEFCGKTWEDFRKISERYKSDCICGQKATLKIGNISRPVILEYYSENLCTRITGPKQKRDIMRQKGVEEAG